MEIYLVWETDSYAPRGYEDKIIGIFADLDRAVKMLETSIVGCMEWIEYRVETVQFDDSGDSIRGVRFIEPDTLVEWFSLVAKSKSKIMWVSEEE